jgi:integrase
VVVSYPLKGVFKVTAKGRDYWYAWRGPPLGPRLTGTPGSPEFHASYVEAHEALRAPDTERFYSLIVAYRASVEFNNLAPVTKKNWSPWLDRISEHFGDLRIAQFERPQKIRPIIVRWRNMSAKTPRAADMGMQALSRVLAHAVDPLGKLASNPCDGIKRLYRSNRADIIWTDEDIATLKRVCSSEIAHAVDLAAHTGFRLSDIVRLSWSHIGELEIALTTSKSRHRQTARIPLYDALRNVLADIPKRSTVVLTNSLGRPWTANTLGSTFSTVKGAAGLSKLHFHDLRGTAATRFYTAGLPGHVIAEILGWEGEYVSRMIRLYVSRDAATKAFITQLNKNKT